MSNLIKEIVRQTINGAPEPARTPPAPPAGTLTPFAVAVGQVAPYSAESVQVWLDYLDGIGYDYMGLGVQNFAQLLPKIVETADFVRNMYASKAVDVQNKAILAALNKKTVDALQRANAGGGNRRDRRGNTVFARSITPAKGKQLADMRRLAGQVLHAQARSQSDRIEAENPEFVEKVRQLNAELNRQSMD